jgi:hypothetical protein
MLCTLRKTTVYEQTSWSPASCSADNDNAETHDVVDTVDAENITLRKRSFTRGSHSFDERERQQILKNKAHKTRILHFSPKLFPGNTKTSPKLESKY